MSVQPERAKFTVEDYYKMIEHEILLENPHEEIIDGGLYRMPPASPPHAANRSMLAEKFFRRFDESDFSVSIDCPITLSEFDEPIPDFCFLKKDWKSHSLRHPKAEDVYLVLEISDKTIDFDRSIKIPLFASARIPEVWLIDLVQKTIEVYSQPSGKLYNLKKSFCHGEKIQSKILPEVFLEVDKILG